MLLPEPMFMHPVEAYVIPGSKRTALIAVRQGDDGEVVRVPPAEARVLERKALDAATSKMAADLLEKIEPQYHRNLRGVIDYAEIVNESPFTASVIFAPDFAKRFAETIGPDLLLVIPNRFQVFVFPKQATTVQEFAPLIFANYRETAYPVSVEVFELVFGRLRAVGVFEEP